MTTDNINNDIIQMKTNVTIVMSQQSVVFVSSNPNFIVMMISRFKDENYLLRKHPLSLQIAATVEGLILRN